MSFTATRGGPSTVSASDGSRTITIRDNEPREEGDEDGSHASSASEVGRITLRGGRSRPRVVWTEDTVDNEGAGKKSSKICCVYHKPRNFDESSSDESSDSDSDSLCDGHSHSHGAHRRNRHDRHHHGVSGSGEDGSEAIRNREAGGSVVHGLGTEEDEVNRYERGPGKVKGKGVVRK